MKNFKKYISIVIICLILLIGIIWYLLSQHENKEKDLIGVSSNYQVQDDIVMMLYNRFHPEDDILFGIIGSDNYEDYYGYYYKNDKLSYEDLPTLIKKMILIHDADYKTGEYLEEENCYRMSLEDYEVIYRKLFGNEDIDLAFSDDVFPRIMIRENDICIGEEENYHYTKTIDTYMVNAINQDDQIIIYERVAFIKETDKTLEFYTDYQMKNKIYSLNKDKADMSFINDSELVSNVLLEYQDKFPIYQYNYVKGTDTYYLESIER